MVDPYIILQYGLAGIVIYLFYLLISNDIRELKNEIKNLRNEIHELIVELRRR